MKRSGYIVLMVCLVVVTVSAIVLRVPRTVPLEECSEVYKRYYKVEGVRASYIKDYRINDTLTIEVTLLEATTDSGWVVLQEDFGLPVVPKEYEEIICGDSNRVTTKNYPKSVPLYINGDTLMNDLIAISHYKHSICHFVIMSNEQRKSILHKQFEDNIKIRNDE